MGFKDFFKTKKRIDFREKNELIIPPAPSTKEELPVFPSPEEVPEIKEVPKPKLSPLEKAEKEAVKAQEEELDEREELSLKKPIFVYLDAYKEILKEVTSINNTVKEAEDGLIRVHQFKEDEDKEFKKWESCIKDIQRKLTYADKTLFGSKK